MAIKIMALLDASSMGAHPLHEHDAYVQADGILQYIAMMEDAQKKAKQAGMPIANVKLMKLASAAVITAQHFLHEVYNWEGLPVAEYMWRAWKVAFRITHIQRQRQLQAMGGGANPLEVRMQFYLHQVIPLITWEQHSTTWPWPLRMTPQSFSSSRPQI